MLTEKDYCDYETCVALAKLGFPRWELPYDILSKKYCLRLYDAQKWLREVKGMLLQPAYFELSDEWICVIRDKNKRYVYHAQKQKNYEEALSEGIKEAVKTLTNNINEQSTKSTPDY